jgi:hypothetical protein
MYCYVLLDKSLVVLDGLAVERRQAREKKKGIPEKHEERESTPSIRPLALPFG